MSFIYPLNSKGDLNFIKTKAVMLRDLYSCNSSWFNRPVEFNRVYSSESVLAGINITEDGKQRNIADVYADFVSSDTYIKNRSALNNALKPTNGGIVDCDTWLYFIQGYSEIFGLAQQEIKTNLSFDSFGAYIGFLISSKIPFPKDNNRLNAAQERFVIRKSLDDYFVDLVGLLRNVCERRCVSDLTNFEDYFKKFLIYYRCAVAYDEALAKNGSPWLGNSRLNAINSLTNLELMRVSNSGPLLGQNNNGRNKQYTRLVAFPQRPFV